MDKLYLISLLEKYYLNGIVERVILNIEGKQIKIKFINPNKNLVGIIEGEFSLEDVEMGIYDTSQLLKLINITDKLISLRVDKSKSIAKTLYIDDNVYNLEYSLANVLLISDVPDIDEPVYDMEANLTDEFISRFIKAAKAVNVREDKTPLSITIRATMGFDGSNMIDFIVGEASSEYNNKVTFGLNAERVDSIGAQVKFPAEEFRSILEANKDMETGKLLVSEEGLLKVEFENKEKIKSTYILVGAE